MFAADCVTNRETATACGGKEEGGAEQTKQEGKEQGKTGEENRKRARQEEGVLSTARSPYSGGCNSVVAYLYERLEATNRLPDVIYHQDFYKAVAVGKWLELGMS